MATKHVKVRVYPTNAPDARICTLKDYLDDPIIKNVYDEFDDKASCMYAIALKCLREGYEYNC